LHGLKFGPDGKLYFTVADRGFNVTNGTTVIFTALIPAPSCAAILDGSEFEVVHSGLRNPQELAFDQYGNLFTGDNNADGGDKARWVYVAEGGEGGWHLGWQNQPKLGALEHRKALGTAGHKYRCIHSAARRSRRPRSRRHFSTIPASACLRALSRTISSWPIFLAASDRFALQPKGATFEIDGSPRFSLGTLSCRCGIRPARRPLRSWIG
jgi:hypothetical protein